MKDTVLGIDISKATFDVALITGDKTRSKAFDNNEHGFSAVSKWLHTQGVDHASVCMEATGDYGVALADYLYSQGHTVYVMNPSRISNYAKSKQLRASNDKVCARVIAEYCRVHDNLRPYEPLPEDIKRLRQLDRRIADLKDTLVREKNRQKSANHPELIAQSISRSIIFVEQEIAALESEIDNTINGSPELLKNKELLESAKGIGPTASRMFLIEFGSFERFDSARAAAAYAGLTPLTRKSGTSVNSPGSISRMGNNRLRRVLYMAAHSASRFNPIFTLMYERLRAAGKAHKVALCAIARHLIHVAYGMIKHQQNFDASIFCTK